MTNWLRTVPRGSFLVIQESQHRKLSMKKLGLKIFPSTRPYLVLRDRVIGPWDPRAGAPAMKGDQRASSLRGLASIVIRGYGRACASFIAPKSSSQ